MPASGRVYSHWIWLQGHRAVVCQEEPLRRKQSSVVKQHVGQRPTFKDYRVLTFGMVSGNIKRLYPPKRNTDCCAHHMLFPKEKTLLLSSVLLTVLIFICVGVVSYDAVTIRNAEEIEEDTSRLLLNTEQLLNRQQGIEIAVRNYVYAGKQADLAVIEENRQVVVQHERNIKEVIDEYRLDESESLITGLLAFSARHQKKIDDIIAYRKAGRNADAEGDLKAIDSKLYIDGVELIIDNISKVLQKRRTEANAKVSLNVLRGSISFGLMSLLMVAVIWVSYFVTTKMQRRNKELSEKLALKATHDVLTALPNRDLFYDRLSQSISLARRKRQHLAVLYLDLDGFKAINDSYGHQVGDATLKEAARRLRNSVRDVDTIARLGGDEFAIVLAEIHATADAGHVAEKIISNIAVPMSLYGGATYKIGVSIGIAIYPDCGGEIDRLVKAADDAMYVSKTRGKNCFTYFNKIAEENPAVDAWVNFEDDFLLEVEVLDEQHEALVDMLNQLNTALAMQEPPEALAKQLDDIIAYTVFHFQTEERLIAEYDYPEALEHKDDHQRLTSEAKYLKARFLEGGELLVLQWLKDWLIGHIVGSDRRLSEYLVKCGVK